MDQSIILDDRSFKALSSESRVDIMKSLNERRRTLSELSQKLALGSSTVKEHCEILVGAELIKQIDEGRKWKYYELTAKGKKIMTPSLLDEVKVLIVLCLGAVIFGGIIIFMMQTLLLGNVSSAGMQTQLLSKAAGMDASERMLAATAAPLMSDANLLNENALKTTQNPIPIEGLPIESILGIIAIAIVAAIIIWFAYRHNRKKSAYIK